MGISWLIFSIWVLIRWEGLGIAIGGVVRCLHEDTHDYSFCYVLCVFGDGCLCVLHFCVPLLKYG